MRLRGLLAAIVVFFSVLSGQADTNLLITSFDHSGALIWTNSYTNGISQVEFTTCLESNIWLPATNQFTTGTTASAQLALESNGFYRVIAADVSNVPTGMCLVPEGWFQMGDALGDQSIDEVPVHDVYVSGFVMDRYEVSNEKMRQVMQWAYDHGKKVTPTTSTVQNAKGNQQELLDLDDDTCRITWDDGTKTFGIKSARGSTYPCVEVTWYGACAYCNFRSEMEGLTPAYDFDDWSCAWSTNGYRLPTEAEWEKAARGGSTGRRFSWWDATITHSQANYYSSTSFSYDVSATPGYHPDYDDGGFFYTSPVGAFPANGYGLHDMTGNVWEWCWDWHFQLYYYDSPSTNPMGPASGSSRVERGGGWGSSGHNARIARRFPFSPNHSDRNMGFRAVRLTGQ